MRHTGPVGPRRCWEEKVIPRLTHRVCQGADVDRWRRPVCSQASGVVLDIGFGSGPNLEHSSSAVTRVAAAEPSDLAWELAGPRVAAFGRPVERTSLDAADFSALPDGSVDTVVTAWALCTVPRVKTRTVRGPARAATRRRTALRGALAGSEYRHAAAAADRLADVGPDGRRLPPRT